LNRFRFILGKNCGHVAANINLYKTCRTDTVQIVYGLAYSASLESLLDKFLDGWMRRSQKDLGFDRRFESGVLQTARGPVVFQTHIIEADSKTPELLFESNLNTILDASK
jgi:hypothetical protein